MRVGTRSLFDNKRAWNKDHPHACGDKLVLIYGISLIIGSSPCVWGQVKLTFLKHIHRRIIPMRVGTRLYEWQ